ncbi:hypothetical protein PWT90_06749 [Aphanocladium album]|nr:hypothetical protein PWT90_06749 [Aphanocladium album]
MTQISRFLSKHPETLTELLNKASEHLFKIGACFLANLEDLPAEIRRDRQHFQSGKELFQILDRQLRYKTLDVFLEKHTECREILAFVFGGKYPRLIQDPDLCRALEAADGTSAENAQKILAKKRPRRAQNGLDESAWRPKRIRRDDGSVVPLTKEESLALKAFADFQTADDDPLMPPSARGRFLTRVEFEALEVKLKGIKQKDGKMLVSPHLTFTLPPASPSLPLESSLSMQKRAETNISPTSDGTQITFTSIISERTLVSPTKAAAAIDRAVDEGCFMEYKGYILEPPASLLAKLKTYLSTPNVEQKSDWRRFSADIQEYLAHLLQIRAGESWEPQLDEVVTMFRAHTLYDDFHRKHPGLDHSLWPDAMKPRPMLRNPFAPPGQQDVAQSVILGRKRKADEEETPSPLEEAEEGDEDELYDDENPISYDNMMLEEVFSRDARDPFTFTRWHNRLQANRAQAAEEARDVTMARMREIQKKQASFSIMDVPRNWAGPVSGTMLLETEGGKTFSDWNVLRLLRASLQRAARRSPRELLDEVNKYVALGMLFNNSDAVKNGAESATEATDSQLVRLTQPEINWLSFLCQASLNDTSGAAEAVEACRKDWQLGILRKRIRKMQRSIVPGSFGDGKRIAMSAFLDLVNQDCDGPVKGHRFTMQELKERIPLLLQTKMIRTEQIDGVRHMRCYPGDVHPEEAIRWPDTITFRPTMRLSQASDEDEDEDDCASPARATVPRVMPDMDEVRTLEQCLDERAEIAHEAAHIALFFRRVAYRLGRTLQEVQAESRRQRWLARDAQTQSAHAASLRTLAAQWASDADGVAVPPCQNGKVITSYRDVVLAAEPEALAGYRDYSDAETEAHCREIVRRSILREAAENKTMLWPLTVPRAASGLGDHEGGFGSAVLRREAVWSFAHPSRRAPVKRFFDVNSWPLEMQSEEAQASIRARSTEDADAMQID